MRIESLRLSAPGVCRAVLPRGDWTALRLWPGWRPQVTRNATDRHSSLPSTRSCSGPRGCVLDSRSQLPPGLALGSEVQAAVTTRYCEYRRALSGSCLVERVAAGARTRRIGVIDREALLLDRVHEVDGRAHQVRNAHLVGHDLDGAEAADDVAIHVALVEVQLVTQARAAARLHGNAQPQVIAALLLEQVTHLDRCGVGENDALGSRFVLNCHLV